MTPHVVQAHYSTWVEKLKYVITMVKNIIVQPITSTHEYVTSRCEF